MVTGDILSATGGFCDNDNGAVGDLGETDDVFSEALSELSCVLLSNSWNGFEVGERERNGLGFSDDAPWNGLVGGSDLDSVGDNLDVVNGFTKGLFVLMAGGEDSCGDLGECDVDDTAFGDRHGAA